MKEFLLFVIAFVLFTILSPIIFVANVIRKIIRREDLGRYFIDCAIGLDQAGGSILYQQENFTISSYTFFLCRFYKNKYACKFMKLINFLFGEEHCKNSYVWEKRNDEIELMNFTKDV